MSRHHADPETFLIELNDGAYMPFVRVGQFKAREEMIEELCRIYSTEAIPIIRAANGNVGAFLLRPAQASSDFLAMTVWQTREDAEAYEKSGQAKTMVDKIRHTFASAPTLLTYDGYGFDPRSGA
jgi:heme-degrading monooxygenase HmoA